MSQPETTAKLEVAKLAIYYLINLQTGVGNTPAVDALNSVRAQIGKDKSQITFSEMFDVVFTAIDNKVK